MREVPRLEVPELRADEKKAVRRVQETGLQELPSKLDAIAVLTSSERERYVQSGVSGERLHILPLPLFDGEDHMTPSPNAVKRNTILFVGRLEHGKGLHVLVEAMPMVLNRLARQML